MKRFFVLASALAAAALFWAWAQPAPPPLAALFPAGAELYLEAKDFGSLLADWNVSAEKAEWLRSANYDQFSRSRLLLRLTEAQNEFATAAGVPPDYALLTAVAGGNSALAIYGIGNLEFLYITRIGSARAVATALWKARGNYQTRRSGGVEYYVREELATHRVAAFAAAGDLLLITTKEDLIAGALGLLAHEARVPLASEKWFRDATQAAQPSSPDVRLVYSIERLRAAPHFRSYWVQRNTAALAEFSSGAADLEIARGEVQERRVLIRANPGNAVDETAAGAVLAAVPDDAGFYRAWIHPEASRALALIREKIFSASAGPAVRSRRAPSTVTTPNAGTGQELETRIDEPPLVDDRDAVAFRALGEQLSATSLDAMLQVESTRAGEVFAGTESAIALLAASPWNAAAIRAACAQAAGSLWTTAGIGALDGLGRIAIAVEGRWVVIGSSADLVNAILSRRNRPAVAGAAYAAGWRHARELGDFERITRLIDFPQIPPAADAVSAREPMFFSENMASFGRVLSRVQSAEIAAHDAGTMLRENVLYRMAP